MDRYETIGETDEWVTEVSQRLIAEHPDIPGDVIADQLRQVSRGLAVLGDDGPLRDAAVMAVESNIGQIAHAITTGGDYPVHGPVTTWHDRRFAMSRNAR